MMTNIKIELTDEQRVRLQEQLTGKRKPITRKELTAFVDGVVEGALRAEALVDGRAATTGRSLTPADLSEVPTRYREKYEGKPDSFFIGWLRGWNLVGRSVKGG